MEVETGDFPNYGFPPDCEPEQFMAWFHLPGIQSLEIWLRSLQALDRRDCMWNLAKVHTLVLARSTVDYEAIRYLLLQTRSLKFLHVGLAYYP